MSLLCLYLCRMFLPIENSLSSPYMLPLPRIYLAVSAQSGRHTTPRLLFIHSISYQVQVA